MVVNLMVSFYRDGLLCTYPGVGTMITQPRGKLFWRGENASYGSSKPSIYRSTGNLSPGIFQAVTKMRYDECGKLLDQMEAPLQWSRQISDVSYMAIMQHYGLPTHMLDITGDIKTALFLRAVSGNRKIHLADGSLSESVILRKGFQTQCG